MYSVSNRTGKKVKVETKTGKVTLQPGQRKSFSVVQNKSELKEKGCYLYRNGNPLYDDMGPSEDAENVEDTQQEPEEEESKNDKEEAEEYVPEDFEELNKAQLETIVDELGLEVEGTGANGNVLKADLIESIEDFQEA